MGQRVKAAADAEAESAVVLLREKHACTVRGVGWFDPAVAGVLVQLGFAGAVFHRIHSVDPVARRDSVGDQIAPVVGGSGGWEALGKVLGEDIFEARKWILENRRDRSLCDVAWDRFGLGRGGYG